MNKEKQIEEMAKIMRRDVCHNLVCANCNASRSYKDKKCHEYHCAKILLEHYQSKIPEDSVVLSREEAERFRGQTINIAKVKSQARKETAEKFARALKDYLCDESILEFNSDDSYIITASLDECYGKIDEIAKQFGVEIKE